MSNRIFKITKLCKNEIDIEVQYEKDNKFIKIFLEKNEEFDFTNLVFQILNFDHRIIESFVLDHFYGKHENMSFTNVKFISIGDLQLDFKLNAREISFCCPDEENSKLYVSFDGIHIQKTKTKF